MMKPVLNIFLGLLITGATGMLSGCGTSSASDEHSKSVVSVAEPELETFKLQQGQLSTSMKIPGELVAFQQVDLYAKVSSFVRKLYVDVGAEVSAGQLLATMEAPELNAQLSGAQSRLKSQEALYLASKATYDRLLETSRTPGTVSQNDLDLAYAKQKSDLAQLDAARAAQREITDTRSYLEIKAPFSGVISARNVSAGAYVGPAGKGSDMPMFTLQEQKKLRLVVSVPEAYTSYLDSKSEVSFTVRSVANHQFTATVSRLAGALDNRLRAQRTEMDVLNPDKRLLPGMVAEVSIPMSGNNQAFVVPASAVLRSTKGVYVIKVANNKAVWVPVTAGRSTEDQTEIFGTLALNDVLVQHASEEIRDSSEVKRPKLKP